MDKERVGPATEQAKSAAKAPDRKPADTKKVQVDRKDERETADRLDEAEREAERAQEERERSQF